MKLFTRLVKHRPGASMRRLLSLILTLFAASMLMMTLRASPQSAKTSTPRRGTLDVLVVDEENRRLQGVQVSLPGYRSTIGLAGHCRFELLPGRYPALISKEGYRERRINAGVRAGEITTTSVLLRKLPRTPPCRK